MDSAARRLGPLEDSLRFSKQVVLAQALADADAARCEESVGHAATDDQMLDQANQVPEDSKLG